MQDVDGVCVALRRLTVTSFELVVELLESCMAKRADTDCTVALLLTGSFEGLNTCLTPPVVDDINISLATHVDILVLSPAFLVIHRATTNMLRLRLLLELALMQDVDCVGITSGWGAVVSFELIVEFLEGCVPKASN